MNIPKNTKAFLRGTFLKKDQANKNAGINNRLVKINGERCPLTSCEKTPV